MLASARLFIGKVCERECSRREMTRGGAHGVAQEEGADGRVYMREV